MLQCPSTVLALTRAGILVDLALISFQSMWQHPRGYKMRFNRGRWNKEVGNGNLYQQNCLYGSWDVTGAQPWDKSPRIAAGSCSSLSALVTPIVQCVDRDITKCKLTFLCSGFLWSVKSINDFKFCLEVTDTNGHIHVLLLQLSKGFITA